MKYKILFQLNSLGYGGTEKAVLSFLENLDREKFLPLVFVTYNKNIIKYHVRRVLSFISDNIRNKFTQKYIDPLVRKKQFIAAVGEENVIFGGDKSFISLVNAIKPDIIHFNRGNWNQFYQDVISELPNNIICVETCIFGREPSPEYIKRLSKFYFVSHWLMSKSSWQEDKGEVLYNPIKLPQNSGHLRKELNISDKAFVLGRIARPNMFSEDLFLIDVIKKLDRECVILIVAASDELKDSAREFNNVKFIEPTTDESTLSKFYNTIDLLLHRRIDGETFGMNIAEAMIHGKPVVSHLSSIDNAQAELLNNDEDGIVGYVAENDNLIQYVEFIRKFIDDGELLKRAGENARQRAVRLYNEKIITSQLESKYLALLDNQTKI